MLARESTYVKEKTNAKIGTKNSISLFLNTKITGWSIWF